MVDEVDIETLTDISDVKKLYNDLQKREQELERELDAIVENHEDVFSHVSTIQKLVPQLLLMKEGAGHVTEVISGTAQLASKVSSKVRQLDLAKGRVQEAIKRVDDILDLKSCVEGVHASFQKEEYEQAAAFIHRYLSLDERALREILPEDTEETDLNTSFTYLHDAQTKLQVAVQQKFDDAVNKRDARQVERFFKLFPLVGLPGDGLMKFSKYLRTQISDQSSMRLEEAMRVGAGDRRVNIVFADTLTHLFETIARLVEDHQPLVDTFYGPGKMFTVLQEIQRECDAQSQNIIQQFLKSRKFEYLCEELHKASKMKKIEEGKDRLEPKELDILLGEIVLLSARMEIYLKFLRTRVHNDLTSLPEEERTGDVLALEASIISDNGLSREMQTLMGQYVNMEAYFLTEMLNKALSMDAWDEESLTSSLVDDVFYIMQKSLRRTLSTSNVNIICAVLNNACSLLQSNYRDHLKTKLKATAPSSSLDLSGMLQGKTNSSTQSQKKLHLVMLNNVDVSGEYLKKLIADMQNECNKVTEHDEASKEKLESCLIDMGASTQLFKELLQTGISQLCSSSVLPQLNPLIDEYPSNDHVLSEDDFQFLELNDPFMKHFVSTLEGIISNLKERLTHSNYESTVRSVCHEVSLRLEKVVLKTSFNRLGGLQLDKELRQLIGYLTGVTEWTVRDKFARLSQITTILNLEKVAELKEYWGENSGSLTWRLTPAEVRQVLALRSDFRKEDIQKLKL